MKNKILNVNVFLKILVLAILILLMFASNSSAAFLSESVTGKGQIMIREDYRSSVDDCIILLYGTKNGGTIVGDSSNSGFATITGERRYTAVPEDGWIFKGWVTYYQCDGEAGRNTACGTDDEYLFSTVGNPQAKFNETSTSIQLNRPSWLSFGESGIRPLTYVLYAVFEPTITINIGKEGSGSASSVGMILKGDESNIYSRPYETTDEKVMIYTKEDGYEIGSVLLDHLSVDVPESSRKTFQYTFPELKRPYTLTVRYRPISYSIKYDGNGSTEGSMEDQSLDYDKTVKLNENKFEKAGYKFVGWNTSKDGTGTDYADSEEISNLTTEKGEEIILYAQWEVETLTGTFNIVGTEQVGETLMAEVVGSNNTGDLLYMWQRDGVKIEGETNSTYILTEKDIGTKISCIVTSSVQTGELTGETEGTIQNVEIPPIEENEEDLKNQDTNEEDSAKENLGENPDTADKINEYIKVILSAMVGIIIFKNIVKKNKVK